MSRLLGFFGTVVSLIMLSNTSVGDSSLTAGLPETRLGLVVAQLAPGAPVPESELLTETTINVEKLLTISGRVEVRSISVPQDGGVLQVENEAVFEVRSGAVETTIGEQ